MHLAGRQTGRTILLTRLTLRCHMRTRGAGGFLFGSELGELGLEGRELVLELGVLVLKPGVLRDEGKDLHGWVWFLGEGELLRC